MTNPIEPFEFYTRSGQPVVIRRVTLADLPRLTDLLSQLSERTRRLRYFLPRPLDGAAGLAEAQRLSQGHAGAYLTLIATVQRADDEKIIGVAELARPAEGATSGELALLVHDDYQREGIGSVLMWLILEIAGLSGVATVEADTLEENTAIPRIMDRLRVPYTSRTRYGERHLVLNPTSLA
jgi:GNAT superfamily N-acetyltransferase